MVLIFFVWTCVSRQRLLTLCSNLHEKSYLEFTAELCREDDLSLAALKFLALRISLLKLLALLSAGLSVRVLNKGEERGTGELAGRGDGDRE